jgi:hypothetical protein
VKAKTLVTTEVRKNVWTEGKTKHVKADTGARKKQSGMRVNKV